MRFPENKNRFSVQFRSRHPSCKAAAGSTPSACCRMTVIGPTELQASTLRPFWLAEVTFSKPLQTRR